MKTPTKSLSLLLLLISIFYFSQDKTNPLANTEWRGMSNIPGPAEVNFKFATDSVDLLYRGTVIEIMKYSFTKDGSLKLIKTEGSSPCGTVDEGLYKYQIINDALTFAVVKEDCIERKTAFDGNSYKKVLPTVTQ